jgi:hypothetical protein
MTEDDFAANLAYLRKRLERKLNGQTIVPQGYLEETVRANAERFELNEGDVQRLLKHLETIYSTTQKDGHTLRTAFKDWYGKEKRTIDFHYWDRLKAYWTQSSILPADVIRSVDEVTDEIMSLVGNPKDKESWNRRRGLVMGHVQMGKTTNYSALISKAADAGYKLIIVLSGITNSLRYQTQVRLDKTFVGKSSVSDATQAKLYEVANILKGTNTTYSPRFPFCGTTQISDFSTATARSIGAHQGAFAEPILFVTKKSPVVLKKIRDWLSGLNNGQQLDLPLLLIDDEADNASINTSKDPDKTTKINERIREILKTCKQYTYIGYTATPFANIFIDPDSIDDILMEDLFPADFIKSLDPPDNYIGSQKLFSGGSKLREQCLREIPKDYVELLPINHKSDHKLIQLPESLRAAVREYIIFRAIRIRQGYGSINSAMLINASRFNFVQEQIKEQIDQMLKEYSDAIRSWSMADWEKSPTMRQLYDVWTSEYEPTKGLEQTWKDVRRNLLESITSIKTALVNMNGNGIDYEKIPEDGLHVIGIGGLALARGLTLEGLAISYALRNVGAADTLLQMGRWFGYRSGYENLCRIHAAEGLIDDFEYVSESVEELRTDFQRMVQLGKTPYDFGLKVRQSPTGIAITAANKMRTATPILLAEDFSTRHIQAHSLHNVETKNAQNVQTSLKFLEFLKEKYPHNHYNDTEKHALVWKRIPAFPILDYIKKMDFPQAEFSMISSGESGLLTAYIEDRVNSELKEWDVGIPYIVKQGSLELPFKTGERFFCRTRAGAFPLEGSPSIIKVNRKNAVAYGTDELGLGEDAEAYDARIRGLNKTYLAEVESDENGDKPAASKTWLHSAARSRPLLLVHFLQINPADGKEIALTNDKPVASVGLLFPGTQIACKPRKYQASVRLIELLRAQREQTESDEEVADE